MTPACSQDPLLSAEGQGQPSRRAGFFRSVLRERKSAVIGLSIIVFFVVLAIIAPYIAPLQRHPAELRGVRPAVKPSTGSAATTAASTC